MKKYFLTITFFVLFLTFFALIFTLPANAQIGVTQTTDNQGNSGIGVTQTVGNTCHDSSGVTILCNYLPVNTPQDLIGNVINAILGLVGSVALLMFVYGGLTWMTSSGSQEKVKKGRDIIIWSAIGLAIIFASYGLVRLLITSIK